MLTERHNIYSLTLTLSFLLFMTGQVVMAATFDVNATDDIGDTNPGDGVCETAKENGVCTLRAAIEESNARKSRDVINLPAATFPLQRADDDDASGPFSITEAVDIVGQSAATSIIDGSNRDRALVVSARGSVNISNVTLQNGDAGTFGSGGGIAASGESLQLIIRNSVIRNNQANRGAGLATESPVRSLTLENCLIENNVGVAPTGEESSRGGGIYFGSGLLTVSESTIRNNTSHMGGGLFIFGETNLIASTVSENTALLSPLVNFGYGGGGLYIDSGGSLLAINATISGNRSHTSAAGLLITNGNAGLYNTTVTGNIADSDSDGVGQNGGISASPLLSTSGISLANSIVALNDGGQDHPDCNNAGLSLTSFGYNLIGNAEDCGFNAPGDLAGSATGPIDPLLGPLADNGGPTLTHTLLPSSPAIDAANPSGCNDNTGTRLDTDQRGSGRHMDGGSGASRCDMGAVEIVAEIIDIILNANAGADQSVSVNERVTVDARGSEATAGIAGYAWTQTAGTGISLDNADSAIASFTAPASAATLTLMVTVTDNNGNTDTDTVDITVTNTANNGGAVDNNVSVSSNSGGIGAINIFVFLPLVLVMIVAHRGPV